MINVKKYYRIKTKKEILSAKKSAEKIGLSFGFYIQDYSCFNYLYFDVIEDEWHMARDNKFSKNSGLKLGFVSDFMKCSLNNLII